MPGSDQASHDQDGESKESKKSKDSLDSKEFEESREFREASKDDLPALVELTARRTPTFESWWITTVFEDSVQIDTAPVVIEDGVLVGYATATHRVGSPGHQRSVQVFVDRRVAGQGVGSALFARCLAAVPPDTTELWTKVHDDEEALAIARHWGFEVVQRSISSRVDLAGATSPTPPPGVTLEACDQLDLGGADAAAFDAMLDASQTNPEAESHHRFTRAELKRWTDPGETPLVVLARVDRHPAALAYGIVIEATGEGGVAYTGVDPAYRGRGLGRLVKEELHARAARLGIPALVTDNEENNAGIRHVNEQLGYVVTYGVYRLRRLLGTQPSD
ncbi:L-amino acid N-acyltransferase YncA [Pedococcus dokdonensis]|uniref:L-amino acid N-acyltransferase YncA n=1 Tax=Pedococcus dokdonensis TaxID=443156 RepID=A0A1H0MFS5_9MICO|nr:GNAT family N-acetyltransferase [Pedococcus dokdonensis]SDO79288.1 L-amino acid N-acyltransferase YncA [Pedococcus dokdonensis]